MLAIKHAEAPIQISQQSSLLLHIALHRSGNCTTILAEIVSPIDGNDPTESHESRMSESACLSTLIYIISREEMQQLDGLEGAELAALEYKVIQQMEREKAAKRKRKVVDSRSQELMSSGLNPGALAALMADSSDEDDNDEDDNDDGSGSDSGSDSDKSKQRKSSKKSKKSKKEETDKERRERKDEKKARKRDRKEAKREKKDAKKARRKDKKAKRDRSESSSDSD